MTDEEKAEEYVTGQMKSYLGLDDYSYGVLKLKITESYLDGLIEGRKESKEYITWLKRQRQGGIQKQFNKANKIKSLEKENAELKAEIKQIIERERVVPEHYLCEMIEKNKELKAQIEKMKNFYNCAHSNRALCPNEHNCKGCKDWELAE